MPLLSIPFKIVVGKSSKNPKVAHFFFQNWHAIMHNAQSGHKQAPRQHCRRRSNNPGHVAATNEK